MNSGCVLEQRKKDIPKQQDRLVHIHIDPSYDEIAFSLLLESGSFVQCLSNNEYIIKSSLLKILDDSKITYNIVEWIQ